MAFPPGLRGGLLELQGGCCFYCGHRITGPGQVDHFLARSRWPNEAIENLVLADRSNGAKSNHLAAAGHLERWVERADLHSSTLREVAGKVRWPVAPDRTRALLQSTYRNLAAGTPLWVEGRTFVQADGPIHVPS